MQIVVHNDPSNKKYILLHLLLLVLLSIGAFSSMTRLTVVSVVLILIVLSFEPMEQSLYLIIMLAPFENLITINHRKVFFAVFLIFLMKTLFKKSVVSGKNVYCLLFTVILVCMEIVNEYTLPAVSVSPYALLNVVFYLLFFFSIIHSIDDINFLLKSAILSFNLSILITIIFTFISYGSFTAFIEKARQANYVFRLGNTTFDTLGGAMGIPLYASLTVALNVVYLTLKKSRSIIVDLFLIAMVALSVVFGVLSVSRAFYLCFAVFIGLYIVINLLQQKKYGFAIFTSIIALLAITVFFTNSSFSWVLGNLTSRMNEDVGLGIRGRIWLACIGFLVKHPVRLLFGMSSNCYDQYGAKTHQLFSFTAHNFILDIVMSFGLIGLLMLLYMFKQLMRLLKERFGKMEMAFSVLPFITLMTFGLTALRTATGKTWIFLVLTVIFMYAMRNKENECYT